jgi:hypothetical protein
MIEYTITLSLLTEIATGTAISHVLIVMLQARNFDFFGTGKIHSTTGIDLQWPSHS